MEIIEFDPTVSQLHSMIAITSAITAQDLSDDKQIALVKESRMHLRDARITIEKRGKELRADALKYQKDVITKEKELLSIIGPEEDRLKELEDQAAQIKVREARKALLPMRREQLNGLIEYRPEDDFLLDMDNDEFITYLNTKKAEKLDRDMAEVCAREAAIADKERLAQVEEAARVAERNRIEAAAKAHEERRIQAEAQKKYDAELAAKKIIDDAKLEADRIEKAAQDKIIQAQAQKEADDRAEEDRKTQQEASIKYQAWLKEIGYTEDDKELWVFKDNGGFVGAFKHVGTFLK